MLSTIKMTLEPLKLGKPGPNADAKPVPGFRARMATANDLEEINEIASVAHFNNGVPILKLYFETSPSTFVVSENVETGKIVAFDSWNRLPNGIYMGFQMVTDTRVRGKGITRLFKTMDQADFHFLGDQTYDSLKRYPSPIFGHKIVGYYGMIQTKPPFPNSEPIHISKLKHSDLIDLCKFDLSILGIDRSDFICKWTLPSKESGMIAHSYVARIDDQVVGYGTVGLFVNYWQINPVYANSEKIADNILSALLQEVPTGQGVFLRGPATCQLLHSFAKRYGLVFVETENRSYSDKCTYDAIELNLNWSKVYALQEFWPL